MSKLTRALPILVAGAIAACGGPATTALPSARPSGGTAPPISTPQAVASPSGRSEPSASALPTTTGVELGAGRYSSSPPFGVRFTFEVPDGAWRSGHLDEEFFDIQQFDVDNTTMLPSRWIAFARPARIRGDGDSAIEGLTAEEAVDLWSERSDLTVSPASPFELDGRDGLRVDIHADVNDTKLFGGPGGDFGLGPEHDARLGTVPFDAGLLLILVLAPREELEDAWAIAEPILDSVDLDADLP